jgi:hypothetical protein
LLDHLERVAMEALGKLEPATLSWGEGSADFARNRRTPGGPADHAVPVLAVHSPTGKLRAVFANYACHCTTIGPDSNRICGDWAGYAQEYIQADHPGSVALIAIGCGADSNPHPRSSLDLAQEHGRTLATEVSRVLRAPLTALAEPPAGRLKRFELFFDPLPTRQQWEQRAQKPGIVGFHARKNLDRLDRGETLPTSLPYHVQTWHFGDKLAMVFLPGEVVVDFSTRLKSDFQRLWLNAYANDVPCYIPSRRILEEGVYEAESSLWYYDRPARLSPQTEELVIRAVHELLPPSFRKPDEPQTRQTPAHPATSR